MSKIHTSCLLIALLVGLIPTGAFAMLHPQQGRFMQRDPLGYVDGMSVYAYVGSTPVKGRDPLGTNKQIHWCNVTEPLTMTRTSDVVSEANGSCYASFKIAFKAANDRGSESAKACCCRYIQSIKSTVTVNGWPLRRSMGGTPLDGSWHIDAWPYVGDSSRTGWNNENLDPLHDGVYSFVATDTLGYPGRPGSALSPGDRLDDDMEFKGTVIDACQGGKVVSEATLKVHITGSFPHMVFDPSGPPGPTTGPTTHGSP